LPEQPQTPAASSVAPQEAASPAAPPQTFGPSGAAHFGSDGAALEEILYGEFVGLYLGLQTDFWQAVTLATINQLPWNTLGLAKFFEVFWRLCRRRKKAVFPAYPRAPSKLA
jgi:hypothetical protein